MWSERTFFQNSNPWRPGCICAQDFRWWLEAWLCIFQTHACCVCATLTGHCSLHVWVGCSFVPCLAFSCLVVSLCPRRYTLAGYSCPCCVWFSPGLPRHVWAKSDTRVAQSAFSVCTCNLIDWFSSRIQSLGVHPDQRILIHLWN